MRCETSLPKHFVTTDVRASGLKSFMLQPVVVVGTGMITDDLGQLGLGSGRGGRVLRFSLLGSLQPGGDADLVRCS